MASSPALSITWHSSLGEDNPHGFPSHFLLSSSHHQGLGQIDPVVIEIDQHSIV